MIELTKDNFSSEIEQYKGQILLDFSASWCGQCRKLKSMIDQLESSISAKCIYIDIDNNTELAKQYNIQSLPTVIILEDNEEKYRFVGLISKSTLLASLKGDINE